MSVISKNKFIIILLLFALLFAGCQQAKQGEQNVSSETPFTDPVDLTDTSTAPQDDEDATDPSNGFPTQDEEANQDPSNDLIEVNELDEEELDHSNDPQSNPDEERDQTSDVGGLDLEGDTSGENTDQTNPTDSSGGSVDLGTYHIMNLHINQPLATVSTRIGQPLEKYTMQGETSQWTVYEYDGFIIGYNSHNRVEFIEVYSEMIDPQLGNHVRVGSKVNDVLAALGEPYTQSSYVINYRNNNVTLKFDLDPIDHTIISIKLFSDN